MNNSKSRCLAVVFLLLATPIAWAGRVANYEFQGTLDSSNGAANSMVDLGTGSFVQDTVLGQTCEVFSFEEQAGLSLDVSGLLGAGPYSFVATMRLAGTTSYAKILDLHDRVLDEGLYAYESGLIFFDYDNNEFDQLSDDVWAQVVLTFDGTTVRGYVDGLQAFANDDVDDVGMITANTLFFFRDDLSTTDGEHSAGRVANIQLYDHALSSEEIDSLQFNCGDNRAAEPHAVPTLSAWGVIGMIFALMIAGLGYIRRFQTVQ